MPQPIVIQDTISIGAGTVNENVIVSNNSLRALARLPFDSKVTLLATMGNTGMLIDFNIGSANFVSSSAVRVDAGAPQAPLDVVNADCYAREGDILVLRVANPTGGAVNFRYMIIAEAMAEAGMGGGPLPPSARVMQQGPISIANGTVDFQLLDGLRYERAARDAIMDLFMTSSAAGLTRSVFIESDRIAPASTISLANRIPQDPFDMTVSGIQVAKDALIALQVTNNSGGALSVFWKQVLQELESVG